MPLNVEEYEPFFVASPEALQAYWPAAEPLIDRCVKRSSDGERSTADIGAAIKSGAAQLFVFKKDTVDGPDVKLVLVLEGCNYPNLRTMYITIIAGSDLKAFAGKFFDFVKGWGYMNGSRAFDIMVSPAMERVVAHLGFKRIRSCIHMRLPLGGGHSEN